MEYTVLITVLDQYQKEMLGDYIANKKYKEDIRIIVSSNGTGTAVIDAINYKNDNNIKKIYLINSGGKSERTKMFSKNGKVFIPIPTNDNYDRIILDELLDYCSIINNNIKANGILVMSSDVLIDNCNVINTIDDDAALTVLTDIQYGKDHGVFIEEDGIIKEFLHKQPMSVLKEYSLNNILIDTGLYFLKDETLNYISNKYNDSYKNNDFIDFYGKIIPDLISIKHIKLFKMLDSTFYHLGNYKNYRDFLFNTSDIYNKDERTFIYKSTIGDNVIINKNSLVFNSNLENINIPSDSIVYTEDGKVIIDEIKD